MLVSIARLLFSRFLVEVSILFSVLVVGLAPVENGRVPAEELVFLAELVHVGHCLWQTPACRLWQDGCRHGSRHADEKHDTIRQPEVRLAKEDDIWTSNTDHLGDESGDAYSRLSNARWEDLCGLKANRPWHPKLSHEVPNSQKP